jgi:hypothetical protein
MLTGESTFAKSDSGIDNLLKSEQKSLFSSGYLVILKT